MRKGRIALGLVLLVLGAGTALLASDLSAWRSAIRTSDARFAVGKPASWRASTVLPGDPAYRLLDLSTQIRFRRIAKRFPAVAKLGNGYDNGYRESIVRGSLESALTAIARVSRPLAASAADNLVGILAFQDSHQVGPQGPAPVERAVSDFQAAAQLDPTSIPAKFNLELVLRKLLAKGVRPGSNSSGGPGKGHKGAGGGLPGKGY